MISTTQTTDVWQGEGCFVDPLAPKLLVGANPGKPFSRNMAIWMKRDEAKGFKVAPAATLEAVSE